MAEEVRNESVLMIVEQMRARGHVELAHRIADAFDRAKRNADHVMGAYFGENIRKTDEIKSLRKALADVALKAEGCGVLASANWKCGECAKMFDSIAQMAREAAQSV